MLTMTFSSSLAQDIDVSNMDNAQLMALLQAIMEKLEDSGGRIQTSRPTITLEKKSDPNQLKKDLIETKSQVFSSYNYQQATNAISVWILKRARSVGSSNPGGCGGGVTPN